VCAWLGNTPTVAYAHYLEVMAEDLQTAAQKAAQQVQQKAALARTVHLGKQKNPGETAIPRGLANIQVEDKGFEPSTS